MRSRSRALKKCLDRGWVPEYEGCASYWDDEKDKSIEVKIYSDSSHRCEIFYIFKNLNEYYNYYDTTFYGRKSLNFLDKLIVEILQAINKCTAAFA